MYPLPMGTNFDNEFDQLVDELFDVPWDTSEINFIEDQSANHRNCLYSNNADEQHITNEVDTDTTEHVSDRQQSRYSHEMDEDSFQRFRDMREEAQQNQRNTQRNIESTRYSHNDVRNHQHSTQRNGRVRGRDGSMGSHASNQQPTQNRNNLRETNQRNFRRQAEVDENNDMHDEFYGHDRYNLPRNADQQNYGRFGNGNHGTMPNNRDIRMARNNQNVHLRNPMSRPVEVYSMQVPGYKPSELQVKVEGKNVRVIGKRVCGCQESCSVREFERVSALPEGIDTRNLQATLNKEGTLSVQSKTNHRLSGGRYQDGDVLVEGLDLPPIEDSSKNTENCVKKTSIKLAKIDKSTGKKLPVTRQYDEVPQRTFENEQEEDGVTIEVVDE